MSTSIISILNILLINAFLCKNYNLYFKISYKNFYIFIIFLFFFYNSYSCSESCNRNPKWRTRNIIQSSSIAKFNTRRISSVFSTNS